MALKYASVDDIKRYLRSEQDKIKIGQQGEENTDVNEDEVESFITDIEVKLDEKLTALDITLTNGACRYVAVRWACYEIYRSLYPRASINEIPLAVQGWKKDADEFLDDMVQDKKTSAGAIGDWSDSL
jgi:hypothetical protein